VDETLKPVIIKKSNETSWQLCVDTLTSSKTTSTDLYSRENGKPAVEVISSRDLMGAKGRTAASR